MDKQLIFRGKAPVIVNRHAGHTDTSFAMELGGGDYICEVAGYLDKQQQLRNLMRSGRALMEYRNRLYRNEDREPGVSKPIYDPTAQIGYDYFDAHHDYYVSKSNMKRKSEEIRILNEQKLRENQHPTEKAVDPTTQSPEGSGL